MARDARNVLHAAIPNADKLLCMAHICVIDCPECGQTKVEVSNGTEVCNSCRHDFSTKKKRMHIASLKGLTVEERLSKIEECLYNLSISPPWEPKQHTY